MQSIHTYATPWCRYMCCCAARLHQNARIVSTGWNEFIEKMGDIEDCKHITFSPRDTDIQSFQMCICLSLSLCVCVCVCVPVFAGDYLPTLTGEIGDVWIQGGWIQTRHAIHTYNAT